MTEICVATDGSAAWGSAAGTQPGSAPPFTVASAPGWPVVAYFHHVHPGLGHYTSLTPDAFARGVDLLLDRFELLTINDVFGLDGSLRVPARPSALLTFDDGYADLIDHALPVLEARDVRATFFVCTHLLGRRSADPRGNHLSWSDCAGLLDGGHSVASHGQTHRPLSELAPEEASTEVIGSLALLRERLGVGRPAYAFPYGLSAPVPSEVPGFAGPLTAFGTVKAAPQPWPAARTAIRRTYLPTGEDDTWPSVVAGWRAGFEAAA
jgi:peptidoglycan/xylan/chitin deacetylase (PgdA/CDA1 family)